MINFQTKTGTTLSIDLQQWRKTPDYSTTIVGETDLDYILSDQHQFEATLFKELLAINSIPVEGDQVTLTESLYKNYFGELVRQRSQGIEKDLMAIFAKVIAHKELIFSRPEYFLIQSSYFKCGLLKDDFDVCLGALLENWLTTDDLLLRDFHPEGDVHLVHITGSFGSGAYAGTFWSMQKNKLIYVSSKEHLPLPERLSKWLNKLIDIARLYPYRIENNELAILNLLSEIGEKTVEVKD